MKKNLENVKLVVSGALESNELEEDFETTEEQINEISENYLKTGEVVLPAEVSEAVVTYDHWSVEDTVDHITGLLHDEFERYVPSERQKASDENEVIIVKIAGREFKTYLDENGTQRFKQNGLVDFIVSDQKLAILNTIAIEYHRGKFSSEDMLDFYAATGYSVSGLMGLSTFQHLPIENPVWDEDEVSETEPDNYEI